MQACEHRQVGDNSGHNYITNANILRNVHDYTSMVELLPGDSTDHITEGRRSEKPQVAEFLERISKITRKDML